MITAQQPNQGQLYQPQAYFATCVHPPSSRHNSLLGAKAMSGSDITFFSRIIRRLGAIGSMRLSRKRIQACQRGNNNYRIKTIFGGILSFHKARNFAELPHGSLSDGPLPRHGFFAGILGLSYRPIERKAETDQLDDLVTRGFYLPCP